MYAVIETGGKQYRVSPGETLAVDRLVAEAGQPYTFDRVLLVSDNGKTAVGQPTLLSARVSADVVEHFRGKKVVAFKMKRRKGYHRTVGHRQEMTRVRIGNINA